MTSWAADRFAGFDTETTGTDVFTDRIVTASIVHTAPGQRPRTITWILDPQIEIPEQAAAVHGWTNQRVLERVGGEGRAVRVTDNGAHEMPMTADAALFEIAGQLGTIIHTEVPLVAANAAYDLSLLEQELARNNIDTLASRPDGLNGVVDPMVLDKQWDPYRKSCYKAPGCDVEAKIHECGGCRGGVYQCGGCGATDRTLASLCRHYGLFLGSAHEASADALAAVRLSVRLGELWRDTGRLRLPTLHRKQVEWRRDQQDGLRRFFTRIGESEKAASVCGEWPVHSACAGVTTVGAA